MKKSLLFLSLIASVSAMNAQWTSQATGFTAASRGLSQITALDANTVWALAYDGIAGDNIQEFTRTIDGGASWSPGTVEMGDPLLEINNISPVNGTTAWVSALVPDDAGGVIFKTTDTGANWDQQLFDGFVTAPQSFLNGVHFWNDQVGIAYGDPIGTGNGQFEIWRTTDGGDNWTRITSTIDLPNPLSGEYGYNSTPTVAGNTLWFTTNKGRLYKTSDMGATWTVAQVPGLSDFSGVNATTGNGTTGNVLFSDANNGFLLKTVIGGSSTIHTYTRTYLTTSSGGASWTAASPFTGTRTILEYIPGTTTMVATSQGGQSTPSGTSVSTNNGATWTDVESAAQRGVSAFIDINTGWCAGFSTDDLTDGVFKLTGQLGVDNSQPVAKFKVYPNPASSVVTISTPDVESAKLSVTDISGKVVMTRSLNGIENTVDISSLSNGAYFFEVNASSKKEVVKIIKN